MGLAGTIGGVRGAGGFPGRIGSGLVGSVGLIVGPLMAPWVLLPLSLLLPPEWPALDPRALFALPFFELFRDSVEAS